MLPVPAANKPPGQASHVTVRSLAANVPGAQGVHESCRAALENWPAGHAVQLTGSSVGAAGSNVPGSQATHWVLPVLGWLSPSGHLGTHRVAAGAPWGRSVGSRGGQLGA